MIYEREKYERLIMESPLFLLDKETEYSLSIWDKMMSHSFEEDNYYFISYSSKDYHVVSKIRNDIENYGIKCWMAPRDIKAGTNYAHVIRSLRRGDNCRILLPENVQEALKISDKIDNTLQNYNLHSVSISDIKGKLTKQLTVGNSIVYT